jgi:alginate lyase
MRVQRRIRALLGDSDIRYNTQIVKVVFLALCLVSYARAAGVPMTLVSDAEAEPIHSAIVRKESWTVEPVRRLRAEAERRLKEGPWTVTAERPQGLALDIHEYYSEAPYWWPQSEDPKAPYARKDGQTNPNRFLANKTALNSMAEAVFTLGTAAYFLDEPRYAQRAARIVRTWFLDPKTHMNPSLENAQAIRNVNSGRGAGILDGRVFIRAIQGMEFLAQTGSWDARDQAALKKWFQDYLHWLLTSPPAEAEKNSGNNHASWWGAQAAAIASYLDDDAAQKIVFNFYRDHIFPHQIKADGSAPREEQRTRSLSYSVFNLEAFVVTGRIAQLRGVDLWGVTARGNATLGTVIEYLLPYLADPKKWNKEQINEFNNDSLYFLAFAGMGLKKPDYIALYRKLERPESAWLSLVDLLVARYEASGHQTRH